MKDEKQKHTPGPWTIEKFKTSDSYDIKSDDGDVATAWQDVDNQLNAEANALLISQAPDLLAERDRLRAENDRLIKLLREKVDPLNIRKLELLSGNERKELLDSIIQKELAKQNKFPMLLN